MTIELGIVVVYMVNEGTERLLDVHLDRIARHTTVPYTIHGSVNRLLPRCRERLEAQPHLKLYELPATELRGGLEHSYYLEHLVGSAIEAGASHVVILHVDSFPVRDGWIEALCGKLSRDTAFVTIEGINTGCLLFERAFYLKHAPRFRLPKDVQEGPAYTQYLRNVTTHRHSGDGYGFEAHEAGLGWYAMRESSRHTPGGAAIYDDLVFHLQGASRIGTAATGGAASAWRLGSLLGAVRPFVPKPVLAPFRAVFKDSRARLIRGVMSEWHGQATNEFLKDPDRYIERLRGRPC